MSHCWLLASMLLLEGLGYNGILGSNFVSLLQGRSYSAEAVSVLLGISRLLAMAMRTVVGLSFDLMHGPIFSTIAMLLPRSGVGLLFKNAGGLAPLLRHIVWPDLCRFQYRHRSGPARLGLRPFPQRRLGDESASGASSSRGRVVFAA